MTRSRDVADTQKNIGGSVPPFATGKNKVINGDFGIWQRGTSFSTNSVYTADRWIAEFAGTATASRQAFTPGSAPVAGYEFAYFYRLAKTGTGAGGMNIQTPIEDVRTLAGQTVTLSYWAKADATVTNEPYYAQDFGSGGSARAGAALATHSITTTWTRYSQTFSMPSLTGKTIGTGSYLLLYPMRTTDSATHTIDICGVQLEAGSAVTPFQTATGTIQGELAACQRYYQLVDNISAVKGVSSTNVQGAAPLPVTMRVAPSISASGALLITNDTSADYTQSSANITLNASTVRGFRANMGNFTGLTSGNLYALYSSGGASIQLSAEL